MGYLLDNVNLTSQLSSASAARTDPITTTTQGGAGHRSSVLQNFSFGNSKLDATASASSESLPWWLVALMALGAILVVAKIFKGKT